MVIEMNSKERVYNTFRGEAVDRAPRFVWLHSVCVKRLAEHFGIPESEVDFAIGNDVLQSWLSINAQMERPAEQGEEFVDEFGITWKRDGYYNMVIKNPLADLEADEIAAYPMPDPYAESRYAVFEELKKKHGDTHFIGADVSGTLFEPAYHMRGMENLLCDMAIGGEEADILLDRLADFSQKVAVEAIKRGADWIWLGDDQGSQASMIAGPDLWRKYFKPRMANIIKAIRAERPDAIVAYHSCGAISPIIPDLYEIGINLLNPIQDSAVGMNHAQIREQFPKFVMGCGLDTQQFMPSASEDEIREAVRQKLELLGSEGYYMYMASHTIQPDVSTENILAMIETLDKHKQ